MGLHYVYTWFTKEDVVEALVEYMVGPAFCESMEEEVERCQAAITELLPLAMPPLIDQEDPLQDEAFCQEVLGVC